jgi:large subunit ribosomal protein L9e
MVQTILQEQSVEIIDGTTVDVKARVITVKGKRGTLVRDFKHLNVDIKKDKNAKGKDVISVSFQ